MIDLCGLDLVAVADALRQGDVRAEEATRWSLQRLAGYGRAHNAVIRLDVDSALEAARGADVRRARGARLPRLHGVPLAHKDVFYRAGRRCTEGSKIRADHVPGETASVLERLDEEGAVDLGALHCAEFALSPTGYNAHYGHGLNPWAPSHVSGGSSSGSGIAVSGRMVFGSLGTDTGGSIRFPAAMCGITGLKPTLRRVSVAGVMPLAYSLDCVGPLAQSARDCARLLGVIAGADARDGSAAALPVPDYEARLDGDVRKLRIASPRRYYWDTLPPEIASALDESLRVLSDLGAVIVETDVPDVGLLNALGQVVMTCEAAAIHRRWLIERPQDYGDQVRSRIEPGLHYPATRYIEALSLRGKLSAEYLQLALADCDIMHLPAIPMPTPTIAATTGSPEDVMVVVAAIAHCCRAINYLGLPALCLPAGMAIDGLPTAFQLVGRPFDEALLLRVGDAFQRATNWHRRTPPSMERTAESWDRGATGGTRPGG